MSNKKIILSLLQHLQYEKPKELTFLDLTPLNLEMISMVCVTLQAVNKKIISEFVISHFSRRLLKIFINYL